MHLEHRNQEQKRVRMRKNKNMEENNQNCSQKEILSYHANDSLSTSMGTKLISHSHFLSQHSESK